MIIIRRILALTTLPAFMLVAGCTHMEQNTSPTSKRAETVEVSASDVKYPDSAMIYHVCHERWLRNGYSNYTFNIEEGSYDSQVEVQRGKFTQVVVANRKVSQAASCELSYYERGASCDQSTRQHKKQGVTIESLFAKWEKNPSLYQSCHPVLGYPTGYGHTYGSGKRRIDASNWMLVSSVIPRKSSYVAPRNPAVAQAEYRKASPSRTRPESKSKKYASITDLEIDVLSSRVKKGAKSSYLVSEFTVTNQTDHPALLGIKGWMLDKHYERYPLSIEGGESNEKGEPEIYTLEVEAHSQMTVSYEAEGVSGINLGKRTAAMLEILSTDGAKMNLTLSNQ